jgi:ATP-dependent helicase/nuclease subunit B
VFARGEWLSMVRLLERKLRGPAPAPGFEAIDALVARSAEANPRFAEWWALFRSILEPVSSAIENQQEVRLSDLVGILTRTAEGLGAERVWAREDGRELARFVEDLTVSAEAAKTLINPKDLASILSDAMDSVAVRPPYGGHTRVAVYGLLEARMSRADLVICGGLCEGVWPVRGSADALLAPPILRALGVPFGDFRIGLAAHDLAAALGAPEAVLSYAMRDESGPTIPSRFVLRMRALLGDKLDQHLEHRAIFLARAFGASRMKDGQLPAYPRPALLPSAEQRGVSLAVTAIETLRGDPYEFYAKSILQLRVLEGLEAPPSAIWQGNVAHKILEIWHEAELAGNPRDLAEISEEVFAHYYAVPAMRSLWQPRLLRALRWVEQQLAEDAQRSVMATEKSGEMKLGGVSFSGKADRIDRLADGSLAIIDYKLSGLPSVGSVNEGFRLQLGLLALIAQNGGFTNAAEEVSDLRYISLGKVSGTQQFGHDRAPGGAKKPLEEVIDKAASVTAEVFAGWITGEEPFTAKLNPDYAGYNEYDHLMRLEEWLPQLAEDTAETSASGDAP